MRSPRGSGLQRLGCSISFHQLVTNVLKVQHMRSSLRRDSASSGLPFAQATTRPLLALTQRPSDTSHASGSSHGTTASGWRRVRPRRLPRRRRPRPDPPSLRLAERSLLANAPPPAMPSPAVLSPAVLPPPAVTFPSLKAKTIAPVSTCLHSGAVASCQREITGEIHRRTRDCMRRHLLAVSPRGSAAPGGAASPPWLDGSLEVNRRDAIAFFPCSLPSNLPLVIHVLMPVAMVLQVAGDGGAHGLPCQAPTRRVPHEDRGGQRGPPAREARHGLLQAGWRLQQACLLHVGFPVLDTVGLVKREAATGERRSNACGLSARDCTGL